MNEDQNQDHSIVGHTLERLKSLSAEDEEICRLQEKRKQHRADLIVQLSYMLREVPLSQASESASNAYWADPRLAEVMKKAYVSATGHGLFPHPYPTEEFCDLCGNLITATSWTDYERRMSQARRRQNDSYEWPPARCRSCDEAESAERWEQADADAKSHREQWEAANEEREKVRARLHSMPDAEYFQTEHWQLLTQAALKQVGYCCQLCNARGVLSVHLRTQERRGKESLADLVVLCQQCDDSIRLIQKIRSS